LRAAIVKETSPERPVLTAVLGSTEALVFTSPAGAPLRHSNFYRRDYEVRGEAAIMAGLINWAEIQFRAIGRDDDGHDPGQAGGSGSHFCPQRMSGNRLARSS
jgi:hypothetical protein